MADSYTVQAILTLKDNLSAGLRNAAGATESLGSKFKSAVGLGAAMQVGMKAVSATMNTLSSHMGDAVSRYDQLNRFPNVMKNLGISAKQSKSALKELDAGIAGLPTTLDSATQGVTRFVSKNGDIKKSTKYFLAMNNAIVAGGQSTELQSAAVEQLSQAYAKGKMDMVEWRSICNAMPAQMNMVAKAMGMSTDKLGEGLRYGTISMDEFMDTLVKLNKEGIDGFASFEEQALTAVGGIKTAFTRMNLAVTRGLANCIGAVDTMLKKNGFEGGIAGLFTKGIGKINKVFEKAAGAIEKINLKGIISGLTPAFQTLGMAAKGAGKMIAAVAKFLNKHAEGISSTIPLIIGGVLAFKAYKKVSKWFEPLGGATETVKDLGNSNKKTAKSTRKLKDALGSLAKMAGVAAIIASIALLAKSLEGIASCGGSAVAPLLGFAAAVSVMALVLSQTGKSLQLNMKGIIAFSAGVAGMALAMAPLANAGLEGAAAIGAFGLVVAGLSAVLAGLGPRLQAGMVGIIVFGAAVSAMALAMAPIAQTGTEGAKAMAVFGIVVAGLSAVFAALGGVLTCAMFGMLAFGATIVLIGAGLNLATPAIYAFSQLIRQAGDTVSQVANAMSKAFAKICDGVSQVIDAVSGGLTSVLNAIAGVIESIGSSARNAGKGFKSVAEGIQMIAALSLWDIGKSLGAVATGMGEISAGGKNLPEVASGMQTLVMAIMLGATNIIMFNSALMTMSGLVGGVTSSITTLKDAFSNFIITPPNVGPFIAAFALIVASANQMAAALRTAGMQAGSGLALGLSSGAAKAQSVVMAAIVAITAVLGILPARLMSIGKMAGNGFATGIQSGLSKAVSISKQYTNQINATLRAAQSGAYSAGYNIGAGLANGMRSQLGAVRSVAAQLAAAAEAAIRAKAKIHSPSKVSTRLGEYFAGGWVNSIKDRITDAKRTAEQLVYIPTVRQPQFAASYGGYNGALNDDYTYGDARSITIEVPVVMDGKEVARVTAPYTETELNKRQTRANRKRGTI